MTRDFPTGTALHVRDLEWTGLGVNDDDPFSSSGEATKFGNSALWGAGSLLALGIVDLLIAPGKWRGVQ